MAREFIKQHVKHAYPPQRGPWLRPGGEEHAGLRQAPARGPPRRQRPLARVPADAWPPLSKIAILVSVRWHLIMLGSVLSRILYF